MARHEKKMEKEKVPPPEVRFRDPMAVVVEKLGDRSARVRGDLSKETLRELLMSSMMLIPTAQSTMSVQDMLDSRRKDAVRQRYDIDDKKKKRKKSKKIFSKKTRGRGRKRTGDFWDTWDLYDEASTDEEIELGVVEDEKEDAEVKSLPSCPSSLTEESDLSYDGKWLRSNMKIPLRMAFKEIVAKKPYDPVGYLGFWLLHYKNCLENSKRRTEFQEELYHLRCLIKQPTPEETIAEEPIVRFDVGEEEENVQVDWNFQHYDINQ